MAGIPAIEVIIRARDEASSVVSAAMRGMAGEAKKTQSAMSQLGGDAGAWADPILEAAERAAGGMKGVGASATMLGSLLKGGLTAGALLASQALADYIRKLDEVAQKQAVFNNALEGFSADPFIAQIDKADIRLRKFADNAQTWYGTIKEGFEELQRKRYGEKTPEQERAEALGPAQLRLQVAGSSTLRQAEAARQQALANAAEDRARIAAAAGDTAGAAAARKEQEDALKRRLDLQKQELTAALAVERLRAGTTGLAPAVEAAYQTKRTTLDEQAAAEQAKNQSEAQRQQQAADERASAAADRLAQRQLQASLARIAGEKEIELIVARVAAQRETAEARRIGTAQEVTAAIIGGVLKVRDAELQAIADAANARARAARGPTRETEVLDIRRKEEQDALKVNLSAAEQVQDATKRGLEDRARREEEFRSIQRSLGKITAEEELQHQQAIMAGAERMSQTWLNAYRQVAALQKEIAAAAAKSTPAAPSGVPQRPGEVPLDPLTRSILLQQGLAEARAGLTPTSIHSMLTDDLKGYGPAAGRPAIPEDLPGRRGPMGSLQMFKDAAGNLTIEDDFEKASTSASKLTSSIKELGTALKDLQTQPGFAAKLSQDLADTLEFLGARHP